MWSFYSQTVNVYVSPQGKSTEETFASHIFKSQAISTSTVPPKIANLEQVAITVKEVPSLLLSPHSHTGIEALFTARI